MPSAQGHTVVRRAAKAGADGVRYWLLLDVYQARFDPNSGLFSPTGINVTRMRQRGDAAAEQTSTGTVRYRYLPKSGGATSWATATAATAAIVTVPVATSESMSAIEIAYIVGSATVDTITVPYISEGKMGPQGLQGCILRTSEWAEGVEYVNQEADTTGTRYLDIAVDSSVTPPQAYKCKKTHISDASKTLTNTTYWEKLNSMAPIYTPLIMAAHALLRFSQTNQLVVMDDDGETVLGGFGGGENAIWVGSTADNTWFRVSKAGYAKAAIMEAARGIFGGFTLHEAGLTSFGADGVWSKDRGVTIRNAAATMIAALMAPMNVSGYANTAGTFVNNQTDADSDINTALHISAAGNITNVALRSDDGDFIGIRPKSRVVTGSYNLAADDHVVIVNTTSTGYITLPTSPKNNQIYTIRKITSGSNMIIRSTSTSRPIYPLSGTATVSQVSSSAIGTYRFIYSADLAAWVQL